MAVNPDLLQQYDAALAELRAARQVGRDATSTAQAFAAGEKAAAIFAGSRDLEELDLRHGALIEAAAALRGNGYLAEAEEQFLKIADIALNEVGIGSAKRTLALYFAGLVQQQQGENARSAETLQGVFESFYKEDSASPETRLSGAALALPLLRDRRWSEVVELLRRIANATLRDESEASIHHNLTLALLRSGEPVAAARTGAIASSIRTALSGAAHPLTVETRLVEAAARADIGQYDRAGEIIRECATVILNGAGEMHAFFARALLTEARRLAHMGDGGGAEALMRRAGYILDQVQITGETREDYDLDALAIPALWRKLSPAATVSAVSLWRIEFQHTLRRYQAATLDFADSSEIGKAWYFLVPATLDAGDAEAAKEVVRVVLADASRVLNAREPADANFIDVTRAAAVALTPQDVLQTPVQAYFADRTWESTTVWSVASGMRSRGLAAAEFASALQAWMLSQGARLDAGMWTTFGFQEATFDQAAAAPEATLQKTLF